MYFYLFPPMSLILCISLFTFLVLLGFLFQSLPFVCLSRWTWGSGGCSIITGVSLGVVFSPYFFSCVPPSLVRQLGAFPCSDAWSLDSYLEPFASSSRGCIQRAVKRLYGKGTGIYSCSITDREECIGAFRWGYRLACLCSTRAWLLLIVECCSAVIIYTCVPTVVEREFFIWGTFATVRAEIPLLRHYHGLCYSS